MARSDIQTDIKQRKPFTVPQEETYLNMARTFHQLSGGFSKLFKTRGLSQPQYNVLRILRGTGDLGLPSSIIAERMVHRVPDITRLVDRLERAGLVQRIRTQEDRRLVLVKLTKKGAQVLADLDEPVITLHQRQLGHMTGKELSRLNGLLLKARQGH